MTYFFKTYSEYQKNASLSINQLQTYTVGNDYQHDIFLYNGEPKSQEYCQFRIENNQIYINFNPKLDFTVLNQQITTNDTVYSLPVFIKFATIKFAIGNSDEIVIWPSEPNEIISEIDILDTTEDEIPNLEVLNPNDYPKDSEENKPINKVPHWLKHKKLIKSYEYAEVKLRQCYLYIMRNIKQGTRQQIYIGSGLILLIFISLIIWSIFATTQPKNSVATQNFTLIQLIKQKYNKLPPQYSNLILNQTAEGKFNISGLVKNQSDITFIKNYFSANSQQMTFNLINSKNAIEQVSSIIGNSQIGKLSVGFDNVNHQISLKGFATNYANLDDAEINISTQLPMAGQIDVSNVFDVAEINKDIKSLLLDNFQDQITINQDLENKTISIAGFLSKNDSVQLQQKIDMLKQKYPILIVNNEIQDISGALPFKIFSVYTGQPSYITTDDGQQVFEGGVIKGFKLQSINASKLTFSGKYQIIIPLNKLINSTDNGTTGTAPYHNLRNQILSEEKNQVESAINSEEAQLASLNRYKGKINDTEVKQFIEQLSGNLQDDIASKKNDIQNYSKAVQ